MSISLISAARPVTVSRIRAPAALLGIFICFVGAAATLRPPKDNDLGWHLRTGYLILQTGSIPRTDPYSFTKTGSPWVEQEWLWQVAAAVVHRLAGWQGLTLLNALLVAIALWLVYMRLRVRSVAPAFAALGAGAALVNLVPADEVRPGMTILVLSAIELLLLEKHERTGDWRQLLLLIPLQAIWANLHGSYVLGLFLCSVYGACALWNRLHWRSLLPWGPLLCGLFTASLMNPQGIGLIRFTLLASQLAFNRQYVGEWHSPTFGLVEFVPLLATVVSSLALSYFCRNWPWSRAQIMLLVCCTLLVLQSNQFVVLYAVAAAPVIAEMLYYALRAPYRPEISSASCAVLALAAIGIAATLPGHLSRAAYSNSLQQRYPVQALTFIQQARLPGPIFNEYDWGGYLIDTLPELPVFIDGRTEMYGETFMDEYTQVELAKEPPQPTLDRYGINLVLIFSHSPVATELRQDASWREDYRDSLASVFVRA